MLQIVHDEGWVRGAVHVEPSFGAGDFDAERRPRARLQIDVRLVHAR
jgi:hypothetical protein